MFCKNLFTAFAAFSAVVSAQNYSVGTDGELMIDPTQISSGERQSWCLGQRNNCPLICGGSANPNSCDADTLDWTCTCTDGSTPNITNYAETMPFFICQQWVSNCVASNPNNATAQFACRAVQCGSQNATALASNNNNDDDNTSTSSASTPASTGSSTTRPAASGATASPSTSPSGAAAALNVAKSYGTGILATGLLAIFGLAL